MSVLGYRGHLIETPFSVTVVIVHREKAEHCVRTGRAFLASAGVDVRLLIVDNASSEVAREHIGTELPDAQLLPLEDNQGFGPAANIGLAWWLAQGEGEWVVVAPHDVIPETDCLHRLLSASAERPRAGLASAEFGEDLVPVVDPYFGGIQIAAPRGEGWHEAGHPHGSLMIARRACLEEVGLFDERYFAYCEEADLAVRARRAGWEIGIVWGARVRNTDLSTALPVIEYLKLRNSLLLVRTHFGRYRTFIRINFALVSTLRDYLRPARRPPGFAPGARARAVTDFLRGRFGPPPADLVASTDRRATAPAR